MARTQELLTREDIADQIQIGKTRATTAWQNTLARRIPSSTDRENIVIGGAVPTVQERNGINRRDQSVDRLWTIHNVTYDALHDMPREAYVDDQIGRVAELARLLGVRIASHPARLISELVADGEVGLCYDGLPFYSDNHTHAGEAVQSNLVSGSGVASADDVATDLWAAIAGLYSVLDDKGEPIFEPEEAINFVLHYPPALAQYLNEVVKAQVRGATSNVLIGLYNFSHWPDARLSGDDWYIHASAPDRRPFIFQEREAPSQIFIGPDDVDVKAGKRKVLFGETVRYAMAYADWRHSCKIDN